MMNSNWFQENRAVLVLAKAWEIRGRIVGGAVRFYVMHMRRESDEFSTEVMTVILLALCDRWYQL